MARQAKPVTYTTTYDKGGKTYTKTVVKDDPNRKAPKEKTSPVFVRLIVVLIIFVVVMSLTPFVNYRAFTRTTTTVLPVTNAVDGSPLIVHNLTFDSYNSFQDLLNAGFGILERFSKAGETGFEMLFGNMYYLCLYDDGDGSDSRHRGYAVVGPFNGPKVIVETTEIQYAGGVFDLENFPGQLVIDGGGWFLDPYVFRFNGVEYKVRGTAFLNPYAAKGYSAEALKTYGEAWVNNGTLPS